MLVGEHGADKPECFRTIGEVANDVGHEPDVLAQRLLGVGRPHLLTECTGEGDEHQSVGSELGQHRDYVGELVAELIGDRSVRLPYRYYVKLRRLNLNLNQLNTL